jgi:RNA polymerase sigma-70 factor (ECF subfamily)
MTSEMAAKAGDSIPTRASLLNRLRTGENPESWKEFYDTYGGLIQAFSIKAGLTQDEAEEVVQETAISVARNLAGFRYDSKVCSFKTWLLRLTTWRIKDRIRRRACPGQSSSAPHLGHPHEADSDEDTGRTSTIDRVPDPAVPEFGAEWDKAYEKALLQRALESVKDHISLKQYQIFDLYVVREWSVLEVARTLGVSAARVYLTKHRVTALVTKEVRRLEALSSPRSVDLRGQGQHQSQN